MSTEMNNMRTGAAAVNAEDAERAERAERVEGAYGDVYAYVDGELDADARAAFEARLAQDPALSQALLREQRLRQTLGDAYAPVLDEALPDRLTTLLQPAATVSSEASMASVTAIDAARDRRLAAASRRKTTWSELGGLAASLLLGTLLAYQFLPPAAGPAVDGSLLAQGSLKQALDRQLSGQAAGAVTPGLSFVAKDGGYCRSFTTQGGGSSSAGLACRAGDHWRLQQMIALPAAPAAAAGQYRQAATALPPALLQSIDELRQGDLLDAAAEAQARAGGWKPLPPFSSSPTK